MHQRHISLITLLVSDYDEAITYYTQTLGFTLLEDTPLGGGKRWVRVTPDAQGTHNAALLLAKVSDELQQQAIGCQAGGRVFLFLQTDHFWAEYEQLRQRGVRFLEAPRTEVYGIVAVFEDYYGNRWDLLELHEPQ